MINKKKRVTALRMDEKSLFNEIRNPHVKTKASENHHRKNLAPLATDIEAEVADFFTDLPAVEVDAREADEDLTL